ncbi:hypothetical protein [Natronolimnohabitans innermongolicus]|uniref:hypothetical protein n=1 Tax=Natronolimnohabitans innermongolicus TaxID=253107 RepID=UPI0013BE9AEF|nr:hypothetical protein [Natronolimnohabitans innermongolicus]
MSDQSNADRSDADGLEAAKEEIESEPDGGLGPGAEDGETDHEEAEDRDDTEGRDDTDG